MRSGWVSSASGVLSVCGTIMRCVKAHKSVVLMSTHLINENETPGCKSGVVGDVRFLCTSRSSKVVCFCCRFACCFLSSCCWCGVCTVVAFFSTSLVRCRCSCVVCFLVESVGAAHSKLGFLCTFGGCCRVFVVVAPSLWSNACVDDRRCAWGALEG